MKEIFLITVSIFVFSTAAGADILHLESGKTVEGTIVEETDDYYKIDKDGMVLTYYEDEVTRVEKGPIAEEISDAPPEKAGFGAPPEVISGASSKTVSGSASGSPTEAYRKYIDALHDEDTDGFFRYLVAANVPPEAEREKMKEMIGFVKAMKPKEYQIVEENIDGDKATLAIKGTTGMGPSTGTVHFVIEDGTWKIKDEEWSSQAASEIRERRAAAAKKSPGQGQGKGSVAGKVTMPDAAGADGKLYFKLAPFGPMEFQGIKTSIVLDGKGLGGQEVTYSFDELPLGEYFVVAVWDLAEPYCENNQACPAFKGDYTGGSQVVEVKTPGETATADIMMMNLLN